MHDPVAQQADDLLVPWDAWTFYNTAKAGADPLHYIVAYEPTAAGHQFVVRTKHGLEQPFECAFRDAGIARVELNRCGTRTAAWEVIRRYVWPVYRPERF